VTDGGIKQLLGKASWRMSPVWIRLQPWTIVAFHPSGLSRSVIRAFSRATTSSSSRMRSIAADHDVRTRNWPAAVIGNRHQPGRPAQYGSVRRVEVIPPEVWAHGACVHMEAAP
jgi:hypothetical protein